MGSSPLARGLHWIIGFRYRIARIIPARAGFTWRCRRVYVGGEDHPRSRGVYPRVALSMAVRAGSSPLARGLRPRHRPTGRGKWIIPARAGFTRAAPPPRQRAWDHPRSRGVYSSSGTPRRAPMGSSPLARGLLAVAEPVVGRVGIIPARAGFTRPGWPPCPSAWDHPRSRGVYPPSQPFSVSPPGSSPLARGLRGGYPLRPYEERIIPARAGFTPGPPLRTRLLRDHPRSRGVYSPGPTASTT